MTLFLLVSRRSRKVGFSLLALPVLIVGSGCISPTCGEGLTLQGSRCNPPGGTCGECGEHAFCDTSVEPNACACVAGYQGSPCRFADPPNLIDDPGFETEIGEGPWVDDGPGATILPFAQDTLVDPGAADLDDSVLCNGGGLLQVVDMPSYALAEPLVVEVTYIATDVHGLGVGFNRSWKRLPVSETWTTEEFCLGQGGYGASGSGGDVEVRISASERDPDCNEAEPSGHIRVDRFVVRKAEGSECLPLNPPGAVLNGGTDPEGDPWDFESTDLAEAGFADGAGRNGAPGAVIARPSGDTGRARMSTRVSVPVPESLASPALVYWWRGTNGVLFDVDLGTLVDLNDRGRHVDTLSGTSSGLDYIYCLPPWTHGSVLDLSFSLRTPTAVEEELVVHDVRITSDPSCGSDETLLDPGFESAPNRWFGASIDSTLAAVRLLDDPELARGESRGSLAFTYETPSAALTMETYALVPASEDDGGPAVKFYSRSPSTPTSQARWILGRDESEMDSVLTEIDWEENVVCLPATWSGRWYRLQVLVESPPQLFGREQILLDDFAVEPDPACPTE